MGVVLRVQVPPKGDHPNRSEPQLRKGDRAWEGSGTSGPYADRERQATTGAIRCASESWNSVEKALRNDQNAVNSIESISPARCVAPCQVTYNVWRPGGLR